MQRKMESETIGRYPACKTAEGGTKDEPVQPQFKPQITKFPTIDTAENEDHDKGTYSSFKTAGEEQTLVEDMKPPSTD